MPSLLMPSPRVFGYDWCYEPKREEKSLDTEMTPWKDIALCWIWTWFNMVHFNSANHILHEKESYGWSRAVVCFDERLYKVVGNKDDEELYLIATWEQLMSALYEDEWLDPRNYQCLGDIHLWKIWKEVCCCCRSHSLNQSVWIGQSNESISVFIINSQIVTNDHY